MRQKLDTIDLLHFLYLRWQNTGLIKSYSTTIVQNVIRSVQGICWILPNMPLKLNYHSLDIYSLDL